MYRVSISTFVLFIFIFINLFCIDQINNITEFLFIIMIFVYLLFKYLYKY